MSIYSNIPDFSSSFNMTIYARESIQSGSALYHSYAKLFLPTNFRRLMLYTGKHFSCECRSDKPQNGLKKYPKPKVPQVQIIPWKPEVLPKDPYYPLRRSKQTLKTPHNLNAVRDKPETTQTNLKRPHNQPQIKS